MAAAFSTGYVLLYFGEMMFWATPDREGMTFGGLFAAWLLYSFFAYVFLCIVSLFKARNALAVFLAGAFFGWFEEGLVLQTTYGSPDMPFPLSISFTGLAWHALIDVFAGWYLVRKTLAEKNVSRAIGLACGIGALYGFWAIFWWTEAPEPMKSMLEAGRKDLVFLHFCFFSLITTAFLMIALFIGNHLKRPVFAPSRIELWILGIASLLYYALVTVPSAPKALWVLPSLMGITMWALGRNRNVETQENAIDAFVCQVGVRHYLCLLGIPLVASAIYFIALAADASLRTNWVVLVVTSALGVLMWVCGVLKMALVKRTGGAITGGPERRGDSHLPS